MLVLRPLQALCLSCLSSLLLLLGVALYARYIEPYWVEETHYELCVDHWQGRPLRVAVVTDLHAKPGDGGYLDALVRRILKAQPDVVVLLGDYVNTTPREGSMALDTLGHHLAPLAQFPCFAVLGNHDYGHGAVAVREMLQSFGAKVMEGKVEALEIGGDTLYLAGMRCQCHFHSSGEMAALPPGERVTCLLLTHSPVGAHHAPAAIAATICGHTHGGQVCLPGGIPLTRPDDRVAWEEMKGLVWVDKKPVYVSRGLGTSELPLRLFCRPELMLVELRG